MKRGYFKYLYILEKQIQYIAEDNFPGQNAMSQATETSSTHSAYELLYFRRQAAILHTIDFTNTNIPFSINPLIVID